MEFLKLDIAMNSFLKNLQDREKKLLLGALIVAFLFVIFIYINSLYDGYITSKKNLAKAKSDYEYVYKKVSSLKLSSDKYAINEANINSIITANDLTGLISDLRIDKTNTSLLVLFNAKNATSAVALSENIMNKTELKINKINYKNLNDSINVILEFNF
jgi:type II secretory pathway component PulM